jgi:hypothetical protein
MSSNYIRLDNGHFQCPHCPKVCEKQNTMYYHVKSTHLQDFKFTCGYCEDSKDRRFVQKSAYYQHLATCHPDCREVTEGDAGKYGGVHYACPFPDCEHGTKTKANTLVHFARNHCREWIPAYDKEAGCRGCQKVFASSTAYLYHALSCIKPVPEEFAEMLKC